MVIRVLEEEDVPEFQALRAKALREEPFAFGMDLDTFLSKTVDEMRLTLPPVDNQSFTLGAFMDGKLVGSTGLFRHKLIKFRHGADMNAMYVDSAARGKGVGKALVQALIERARTFEGLEMISLTATHTQTSAIEMYRKVGFESWGYSKRTMKVGEEYADFVHMTLML